MLHWLYLPFLQTNWTIDRHKHKHSTANLLLGIVFATTAFPFLASAIAFSFFVSQEKWEEFWNKFLEV